MKYIDSKPPTMHTKLITKSKVLDFHPIEVHCIRPKLFEQKNIHQILQKIEAIRMTNEMQFVMARICLGNTYMSQRVI